MYVQPLDGSLNANSLASLANTGTEGSVFAGAMPAAAGDNISRFVPPWSNESGDGAYGDAFSNPSSLQGAFGSLMGMLQQLMTMLQSLMGYGCNAPYGLASGPQYGSGSCPPNASGSCPPNGSTNCPPYRNERFFQNASGSSDGDPHLSFNGARWNNMTSQPDLLNSNSFAGGFQISTQATPPNGKGIAWNQSATVALNNGATKISMNNDGQATITNNGQQVAIEKGQTLQLGDGESVTYEQNGALRVNAANGNGGRIETTLTPDGKGVNVDVTAHDVDLGGSLVNGWEERRQDHEPGGPWRAPWPIREPIDGPNWPAPDPYPHLPNPRIPTPLGN
ncbi:MAG: hypothetical protein JO146_03575 [Candidatus Eremiobacteraeota bacterium]|nr:hypothetical protein [Candidatus Eremiobacteraeota bacterium]